MVKRISCRVIRSVAFGEISHDREIGNTAAATFHPLAVINPAKDTDILNMASGVDFPIGQILDCYA